MATLRCWGLAGILEVVLGFLVGIGFLTSYAAFIASGEMAVAYFKSHHPRAFWPIENQGEVAVLFCFIFLWIATRGGGAWSVDAVRGRAETEDPATTAGRMPDRPEPYRQSVDDALAALGTDARQGLSEGEARARLARHGRNELAADRPVPAWRRFLAQFQDALVVLLLIAAAISAALWLVERDAELPYEAMAILAVVFLNAAMGFLQQSRADQAVAALRQMSAAHARVVRDGEQRSVAAAEVVPGDIMLVEEGDTIAADARLIHSTALQTAEAALTGESLPVAKHVDPIDDEVGLGDRHNMIFSGTAATYGRGLAVVTATGMRTQMGRIAGMLKDVPAETTPLQRELTRVGKILGIIVVVIAVAMIATIIAVERVRDVAALFDVLILGVALAVAAVPEGLPAVVTAVLALGVQRMARRNAIVRRLAAVETLGSADVVASDKTGTLTRNEMTVRVVVTASGRVRLSGTGYAPDGGVTAEGAGPPPVTQEPLSQAPSAPSSSAPSPSATVPTTPRCRSATAGGRCRATPQRARWWWRRARPAWRTTPSTRASSAWARCPSPPRASS